MNLKNKVKEDLKRALVNYEDDLFYFGYTKGYKYEVAYTHEVYGIWKVMYRGYSRYQWLAWYKAKLKAVWLDIITPRYEIVKDAIRTSEGLKDERREYPYGIKFCVREL